MLNIDQLYAGPTLQGQYHHSQRYAQEHIYFRRFRKILKSDYQRPHVCLSVCPHLQQLGFHWTDIHEILYSSIFGKSVDRIQVSLKYALHEDQYTFMIVSRSVLRMEYVSNKSCRENLNTHFMRGIQKVKNVLPYKDIY